MRPIVREAQRLRSILRGPHDHAALTRAIGDTVLAIALHLGDEDTRLAGRDDAFRAAKTERDALAPRPGPGGRVGPATDEDIADDEAMCLSDEPLDWDEECTREAVLALIARVRQEQDRADGWKGSCRDWEDKALTLERERDEAVARADSEERGRHQIEDERDEAAARAEKAERERDEAVARVDELKGIRWRADAATRKAQERAEEAEAEVARMRPVVQAAVAEVARMRPVVEAAIDAENANAVGTRAEWIEALGNVSEAVHAYRAARKEADRG